MIDLLVEGGFSLKLQKCDIIAHCSLIVTWMFNDFDQFELLLGISRWITLFTFMSSHSKKKKIQKVGNKKKYLITIYHIAVLVFVADILLLSQKPTCNHFYQYVNR